CSRRVSLCFRVRMNMCRAPKCFHERFGSPQLATAYILLGLQRLTAPICTIFVRCVRSAGGSRCLLAGGSANVDRLRCRYILYNFNKCIDSIGLANGRAPSPAPSANKAPAIRRFGFKRRTSDREAGREPALKTVSALEKGGGIRLWLVVEPVGFSVERLLLPIRALARK